MTCEITKNLYFHDSFLQTSILSSKKIYKYLSLHFNAKCPFNGADFMGLEIPQNGLLRNNPLRLFRKKSSQDFLFRKLPWYLWRKHHVLVMQRVDMYHSCWKEMDELSSHVTLWLWVSVNNRSRSCIDTVLIPPCASSFFCTLGFKDDHSGCIFWNWAYTCFAN